jgi:hypothetical protein
VSNFHFFEKKNLINNYQKERHRTHNLEVSSPPRYHTAMESAVGWWLQRFIIQPYSHIKFWKQFQAKRSLLKPTTLRLQVHHATTRLCYLLRDDDDFQRFILWSYSHIEFEKKVSGKWRPRTHYPADARPPRYHIPHGHGNRWKFVIVNGLYCNRSCYGLTKQKSREGVIDWYTNKQKSKKLNLNTEIELHTGFLLEIGTFCVEFAEHRLCV